MTGAQARRFIAARLLSERSGWVDSLCVPVPQGAFQPSPFPVRGKGAGDTLRVSGLASLTHASIMNASQRSSAAPLWNEMLEFIEEEG